MKETLTYTLEDIQRVVNILNTMNSVGFESHQKFMSIFNILNNGERKKEQDEKTE